MDTKAIDHAYGAHAVDADLDCRDCIADLVTEDFCFLCGRSTDHRGEH